MKPYTGILDAVFDSLASFGDLFMLVASIPVNYVLGFYRRWTSALDPPQADPQTWHQDGSRANDRPSAHRAFASESNGDARPEPKRDVSTGSVRQTRSAFVKPKGSTATQQIWHPPASAYTDEIALNPHSGLPTPPIERQQRLDAASPDPVFPSAYPPTPQSVSSRLPGEPAIVAPRPVRAGNAAQFAGIAEEDEAGAHSNPTARQDFRKSLLLPREPRNPGSDGDLSDEDEMKGVQISETRTHASGNGSENEGEDEMNVDEEDGDYRYDDDDDDGSDLDDDVFNTTLQTPSRRRIYRRDFDESGDDEEYLDDLMLTPPPMKTAFSIDSVASRSTGLSTTDNGSSLRTRTNSVASTDPTSIGDAPSLASKKRKQPPRYAADDAKFSLDVPPRKAGAAGKSAASRGAAKSGSGTITRRSGKALQEALASAATEDPEDEDTPDDGGAQESPKRQRAANGRAAVGVRPKPQRGDSQATIRGAPANRGKAAAGTTRPAVTRPPSARVAAAKKERPVPLPVKKTNSGSGSATERKTAVKGQKTVAK